MENTVVFTNPMTSVYIDGYNTEHENKLKLCNILGVI